MVSNWREVFSLKSYTNLIDESIRETRTYVQNTKEFQTINRKGKTPRNLEDPSIWKGLCWEASEKLVEALRKRGISSRIAWLNKGEAPVEYTKGMWYDSHANVELLGNRFIDVTSPQFGIFPLLDMYRPDVHLKKNQYQNKLRLNFKK
jgi:hypothetical protein